MREKIFQKSENFLSGRVFQSHLKESDNKKSAEAMMKELLKDYKLLRDKCLEAIEKAQKNGDEATVDLLVGRVGALEKEIWMFEASVA